ncbi:MAG: hypothetical protein WB626_01540 [Bacteroidota bacterium]
MTQTVDRTVEQNLENRPKEAAESDALFTGLWERIRAAGEVMKALRGEKAELGERVARLEARLRDLEQQTAAQREMLAKAGEERRRIEERRVELFPDGDRESVRRRLRDLLARIEAYL